MARPNLRVDPEIPIEINEYHNGAPAHETTETTINQEDNYRYRTREENRKTNLVVCSTIYPSTTQEWNIYSDLCGIFQIISNKGNRSIYVMYIYYCNAILTTPTKNRSGKDMIRTFTELTKDLKIRGLSPGFHIMDNEAPTE